MEKFTESVVEEAAVQWFGELGFAAKHGPHIAPGELHAERTGFRLHPTSAGHVGETVLAKRLRDALLPKLLSGAVRVRPERMRDEG
jgi:type I restriction enzyme R subunit